MPRLTCEECGCESSADAAGWRAEVADDDADDRLEVVAVFCPACWQREFGPVARPE